MENLEINVKTVDGEINLKLPDNGYTTWMELTGYFSRALKALGYFPNDLDEFLEKYEERSVIV